MHKVKVIADFSAAHFLRGYKGKCESLHGHNWKVEVVVSGSKLDSLGMVIDFSDLKKLTKAVLEELDHQNISRNTILVLRSLLSIYLINWGLRFQREVVV